MKHLLFFLFALLACVSLLDAQDDRWTQFVSPPIVDGPIHAIYGDADYIYVGGNFRTIEGIEAQHLARYIRATQTWEPFGPGTSGPVYAINRIGDSLYIGGDFIKLGVDTVNYFAACRLSDSTWHKIGLGINGFVYTMAQHGDDLYIGGEFELGDVVPAMNIVRWSTTAKRFDSLRGGLGRRNVGVHAILVDGDTLYAGGYFASTGGPGGTVVNNIARWDINAGAWSAMGNGVSLDASSTQQSTVLALAIDGDNLYVGGRFDSAGSVSATNFALWTISSGSWSSLAPPDNGSTYAVRALATVGNDIYVGARDYPPGQGLRGAPYLRRWTVGSLSWFNVGDGVDDSVLVIRPDGSTLLVGGKFSHAGDAATNGVAAWNLLTSSWQPLRTYVSTSVNGPVNALLYDPASGNVYVGGQFSTAGDLLAHNVARLGGTDAVPHWSTLGTGVNGTVYAMAMRGTRIYVGGSFSQAGGIPASNIAVWDTVTGLWSALGNGLDDQARAILPVGNDLYVTGAFTEAGGNPANGIARWNGSTWSALDAHGIAGAGNTLAVIGDELFVGGNIFFAGGSPVDFIARWNMSTNQWSSLDEGMGGPVYALGTRGKDLFVGGAFQTAGARNARNIARWNTESDSWDSCGTGVENTVHAIVMTGSEIVIAGDFTAGGGTPMNYVATGTGGTGDAWMALGSGVNGVSDSMVGALAATPYHVWIGGRFVSAGGKRSIYLGRWLWNTASAPRNVRSAISSLGNPIPNPTRDACTFTLELSRPDMVRVSLVSTDGRDLREVAGGRMMEGRHELRVPIGNLPNGLYLLVARVGDDVRTARIVVE